MKRLFILLFSVLLLACVPTPEKEYVVEKAPNEFVKAESAQDAGPAPTYYLKKD